MINLSVVILTKNEQDNLTRCLDNLKFADEIIIIDDFSEDKTLEIAKRYKVSVYKRNLNSDFSSQRNFALSKAKGKWVLFVDADEVVSENLAKEISDAIVEEKYDAFYLKRRDFFFNKELKYGETGDIKLIRLARRTQGKWYRRVHEIWQVTGRTCELDNPIFHFPHRNISEFVEKINLWSNLHALANYEEGKRSSIFKIIFMPGIKFIDNWILRLGILDGEEGLIYALMMSFHSFLSWGQLWLYQRKILSSR